MKKVLMMALMLATVISVDVMAQPAGGNMAEKFDDNGCFIIKEDMKEERAEKIAAVDTNNDGCITRVEFRAAMPEGGKGKRAKKADAE